MCSLIWKSTPEGMHLRRKNNGVSYEMGRGEVRTVSEEEKDSGVIGTRAQNLEGNIHSALIHSGYFYSAPSSPLLLRGAPDYSTDTVSEFHAEAPQATASEGLAQGPYVAAREELNP